MNRHFIPRLKNLKKFRNFCKLLVGLTKIDEMNNLISKELKIKNIPSFNKGIIFENKSLWRMEPLKWWLFNKEIEISEQIATILDMSHAFTGIEITGDNSSLFLNRHLPIDLRARNFPDLSSASTAIHHVSVKLFKITSNNYCLYIPRGFCFINLGDPS